MSGGMSEEFAKTMEGKWRVEKRAVFERDE